MGRKKLSAREGTHRGRKVLKYRDEKTGKMKRIAFETLGATNRTQREQWIRKYQEGEQFADAKAALAGGYLNGSASLATDIQEYLAYVTLQRDTRLANPAAGQGISEKSYNHVICSTNHFRAWLTGRHLANLLTSDLTHEVLTEYVAHLVSEPIGRATAGVRASPERAPAPRKRSGSTVAFHLRNLRACLNWIRRHKKRRFEDPDHLLSALKSNAPVERKLSDAPEPAQLEAFLRAALRYEAPGRTIDVAASVRGKRARESYRQTSHSTSATPVSRLFIVLALLGCRLSDALNLKWENVIEDCKAVRYTAIKNKSNCVVPLVDTHQKVDVAPRLSQLLGCWLKEARARWQSEATANKPAFEKTFVLPHGEQNQPVFPRHAWRTVRKQAKTPNVSPQQLRKAFTSYAAPLGIPAAVAAQWQGHSAKVAEEFYRLYAKTSTKSAANFEEAMGLAGVLDELLQANEALPAETGQLS